jgi:hypothetical protein
VKSSRQASPWLLLAAPHTAAWTKVITDAEFTGYADTATATRDDGKARMWELDDLENSAPKRSRTHLLFGTTLWEFDCRDKLERMVSVTWHAGPMGTGEIVQTGNPSPFDWRPIATGSIGEAFLQSGVRREMRARQSSEFSPLTASTCSRN